MSNEKNHNKDFDLYHPGHCACHRHRKDDTEEELSTVADESYIAFSISLKKGVNLLKIVLLILLVGFLLSNIFWIEEGNVAIQTRFGRIVKKNENATISPGGPYYALPSPIDNVIKIPTTIQNIMINKAFWTSVGNSNYAIETKDGGRYNPRPSREVLIPGEDGSLITGDKNIVQGVWSVSFKLNYSRENSLSDNAPELFLKNIGTMENANKLVKSIVEQAIVKSVGNLKVEDFIKGKINNNQIKKYAMQELQKMKSGLKIVQVTSEQYAVPKILKDAFQAVNKAQSEKAAKIESAKRYRVAVLNNVAGPQYANLIAAITKYEQDNKNSASAKKVIDEQQISKLINSTNTGGKVSEIINQAKLDKTQAVEFVKAASKRFSLLLKQYNETPEILKNRLLEDTFQTIFSGNVKTYYLPQDKKKTIYLQVTE